MEFEPIHKFSDEHFDESITIRTIIEKYSHYLRWFIISMIVFLLLAFIKILFEAPKYNVSASILIKEKEEGTSFADLSGIESLGLFGSGDNSLENEMEILKSRKLMVNVVKELKLNIRYFIENDPIDIEVYPNYPVVLNLNTDSVASNNVSSQLSLDIISKDKFEVFDFTDTSIGTKSFDEAFSIDLGNEDQSNKINISISRNGNYTSDIIGKRVHVYIGTINGTANDYMDRLILEPIDPRFSKVLKLSIEETNTEKGIAILNNLIEQYNADGINDKDLVAQATTNFLDDRLVLIANELEAIESSAAQFKTNKGMIDVNTGAGIYLQSSSAAESNMVTANTQMQLVSYMLDELNRTGPGELLPGNIGLSDPSIVSMISDYNGLVLQRNRVMKSSSDKNPIIVNLDSQIEVLRNNLAGSLRSLQSSAQIQVNAISRQSGSINSKIASVPKFEKEYKDIVRDQETKNALYLFLLQKREESILSNAVKVEKAKVVDPAYSNQEKISPKVWLNFLGAILLGFLVPFSIIYLMDLLDTKVHDQKDIQKLKIPYLGDVPLTTTAANLYIKDGDNTNIAEAFRYIRTNINFMLDTKNVGKTVFVTSTQSGEGKTFTSINLANSLAISGKKTLLLGMDLRAPKMNKYLNIKGQAKGVTNFIKDPNLNLNDIVSYSQNFENLHVINSGDIPPNPVELLMSKRVKELFDEAKRNYEYIIVDTAPVGMVTDTIQIASFADLTIFVIKSNALDKRMLHIPEKLSYERKLPNMAILINASDHSKGAYGYGYGYKYGLKQKKPWYKKMLKSAAFGF